MPRELIVKALHHTGLLCLARRLSREEFRGCRVLNFHRVLPTGTPRDHYAALMGEPTVDQLDRLLRFLKRRFRFTTPEACVARWRAGREVEPYSLILTFDDGYADLHSNLLPLLQKHQVPATIFLTTGAINGRPLWFQRVFASLAQTTLPELSAWRGFPRLPLRTPEQHHHAIETVSELKRTLAPRELDAAAEELAGLLGVEGTPGEEMMSWEQVAELHRSGWVNLGGHTVTHPVLTGCTLEEARRELVDCATELRSRLGLTFLPFAYPNGGITLEVEHLVEEAGYDCAFHMKRARNTRTTSLYRLGREYVEADSIPNTSFILSGLRRLPGSPLREGAAQAPRELPLWVSNDDGRSERVGSATRIPELPAAIGGG